MVPCSLDLFIFANMTSHANMRLAHISSPESDHCRRTHQLMSPNITSCMSDYIISNHLTSARITSFLTSAHVSLLHNIRQNISSLLHRLTHILSPLEQGTKKVKNQLDLTKKFVKQKWLGIVCNFIKHFHFDQKIIFVDAGAVLNRPISP